MPELAKALHEKLCELGFKCDCYPPKKAGQRRLFCIWVYYSDEAYIALQFYCEDLANIKIIRNT